MSIIEEYWRQADELVRLLAEFPPEGFGEARPAVAEIVGRLADAELLASVRIRRMITQDRPLLHGHDPEEWSRQLNYWRQDIEEAALRFAALRRADCELLGQLGYQDWNRAGRYDGQGEVSLFQFVDGHLAETAARLAELAAIAAEREVPEAAPPPAAEATDDEAGGAKFYALALLAGLTILAVGFFMQSTPVYIFGGIVSAIGLLLVVFALVVGRRPRA